MAGTVLGSARGAAGLRGEAWLRGSPTVGQLPYSAVWECTRKSERREGSCLAGVKEMIRGDFLEAGWGEDEISGAQAYILRNASRPWSR